MKNRHEHFPTASTRRDFLTQAANGFGSLALSYMLARDAKAGGATGLDGGKDRKLLNPLATKPPHFPAKAKAVIFLYMVGGPSHMETFDPKPTLDKLHGQQMPASFGEVKSQFVKSGTPLMGSAWKFKKYGQSGIEVSDLFPHLATCVDDMAFIRSCYTESFVHAPAMYQIMCGRVLSTHPSRGDYLAPPQAEAFNRQRGGAPTALLIDSDGTMGHTYGAVTADHMFIIAASGTLVYVGGIDDSESRDPKEVATAHNHVRAALSDLLAGRRVAKPSTEPFGCAVSYAG